MTTIYQGDQYAIPFTLSDNGQAITPYNCDGVRFAVGGIVQSYPDGGLSYDNASGQWLFFLSAEYSDRMQGEVSCQAAVKVGDTIRHSAVQPVDVARSVVKGGWSD